MIWIGIGVCALWALLGWLTLGICKVGAAADRCMERELQQFMQERQGCTQDTDSVLHGEGAVNG